MGFFKKRNDKRSAPKWKKKDQKAPKKVKLDKKEDEVSSDDEELFNLAKHAQVKEYSDDDYEDIQTAAYRQAKELLEKVKVWIFINAFV